MLKRIVLFLVLNFGALAIGGLATSDGVVSDWYAGLEKAPWTPPGWVFGAAWTLIMVCFSLYLAILWDKIFDKQSFIILYCIQWVLNVGWNPLFFQLHYVLIGFIVILLLTLLIGLYYYKYWKLSPPTSNLILPYLLWLLIATSLNGYILLNN